MPVKFIFIVIPATREFVLLIVLVIAVVVVTATVVVVIVTVVVGTPKAHTNVGDLHASIKQSQLVVLPHSPFHIPRFSSSARTLSTMLCPRRIRALCQVVMNIWPAVAFPPVVSVSDLSGCSMWVVTQLVVAAWWFPERFVLLWATISATKI